MKQIFFCVSLVLGLSTFAQDQRTGADRICGEEFSQYGLGGKTFREALDQAGSIHNTFQTTIFEVFRGSTPNFSTPDTNEIKEIVSATALNFFGELGFNYEADNYPTGLATSVNFDFQIPENYSEAAQNILVQFKELLNSYSEGGHDAFIASASELKESALLLDDVTEVFAVGVPLSIAINSFNFWKENAQNLFDSVVPEELTYIESVDDINHDSFDVVQTSATVKNKVYYSVIGRVRVNLWQLGGADVTGAIVGAQGGLVAGPGGSFAGAVLGGATASTYNAVNQIINHYVSWWPF